MNCKPGDLAVIVGCTPGLEFCLGHICRIVAPIAHPGSGEAGWEFSPPVGPYEHDCTLDRFLRPIRPAGDDEPTQETRKLPADAVARRLRETIRAFRAMREHGVCP